jgi:hypothetical protein
MPAACCGTPPITGAAARHRAASSRTSPFDTEHFYSLDAHAVLSKWGPDIVEHTRQLFSPAPASACKVRNWVDSSIKQEEAPSVRLPSFTSTLAVIALVATTALSIASRFLFCHD